MKKLITIALLLLYGVTAKSQCAKIDIVIITDLSGSVGGNEYLIREALDGFIGGLELDDNGIKVGIITFNYTATLLHKLSSNKGSLLNSTEYARYADGGTYMENAFIKAGEELALNGRLDSKKVIIIISDGSPSSPSRALHELNNLKYMFFPTIFGILIKTGETNEPFMKSISSEGCYLETRWESLLKSLNEMNLCL